MDNILTQFNDLVTASQYYLPYVLMIVALLWAIHFLNVIVGGRLAYLGIFPRHPFGLLGVIFSPFIHADFNHIFVNTIPLILLLDLMMLRGMQQFFMVSALIIVQSGLLVWLFGRRAIHVGASSVIMGFWGYLLINSIYEKTIVAIITAILCLYYAGGLVLNLFPTDMKASWEGHVFGFLAGVAAVYEYPWIVQHFSA